MGAEEETCSMPFPSLPVAVSLGRQVFAGIAGGLAVWLAVYPNLELATRRLTGDLLGLDPAAPLGSAVLFFTFEVPKVLMLLTLVVFGVRVVRTFFTPERTRAILAGKRESVGNVFATLLGIVTPLCSCSAVPLFIGFVTAGVPMHSNAAAPARPGPSSPWSRRGSSWSGTCSTCSRPSRPAARGVPGQQTVGR